MLLALKLATWHWDTGKSFYHYMMQNTSHNQYCYLLNILHSRDNQPI